MERMIFVNLPVRDLARAEAFCAALGGRRDARFSDDTAACMALSSPIRGSTVHVMLLTHATFAGFAPRPIADAHAATGVLLALSAGSRAEMDGTLARAVAAGGQADPVPPQGHGSM